MKITEELIRLKAYEIWEASGRPAGSAEQHWFAAKNLLKINSHTVSGRKQMPPNGLLQLTSR